MRVEAPKDRAIRLTAADKKVVTTKPRGPTTHIMGFIIFFCAAAVYFELS